MLFDVELDAVFKNLVGGNRKSIFKFIMGFPTQASDFLLCVLVMFRLALVKPLECLTYIDLNYFPCRYARSLNTLEVI